MENKEGALEALCILFSETKGIQWTDTDATHEYGSRQALVNEWFMHMGVIENPREKRV